MNTLKSYVNWKLTHADKTAEAEGYPLVLENCKSNKRMKQLEVYGNSVQDGTPTPDAPIEVQSVGELVTDVNDDNYGKYKIPVVQRGVNLFDVNKYPLTKGYYIHAGSGLYNPDGGDGFAATNNFIPCEDLRGKTITINHTKGANAGIAFYNSSRTYISGVKNDNGSKIVAIVPDTAEFYRFCIDANYIHEAQVQTGSVVAPYEPYIEPTSTNIFLNEPLRKIDDYADYVDFKNRCVVRRNKEIVLKGADITYRYTSYGSTRGFYIYGNATKYNDAYIDGFYTWDNYKQPEKSTHFIANQSRGSGAQHAEDWYININYNLRFHLAPEAYASDGVSSTLADIQSWVQAQYDAGTPLKFIYRLVQPIEETITCELPKLNAKTTIIEVGTSLAPSDAYGKYIKR